MTKSERLLMWSAVWWWRQASGEVKTDDERIDILAKRAGVQVTAEERVWLKDAKGPE